MKILSVCSLCLFWCVIAQADPTKPAAGWQAAGLSSAGAATATLPKLQLIKHTADGHVAVLDGVLVRKGQRFQQYLVLDIQQTKVIMDLNGEQLVLPLLNTAIKQYE
ncbi:hypothetical protein LHL18_17070 [Rheinheimera aquimaris]|uniref:hypothetical protein n=1 Tax=Rheinheimera aquimaris TaxID=412437 RepID=UPI001CFF9069|nr:hypothetical protein [Rheinheimera aquimaris]MCB5215186.1 hypothetical protein [Rheinheimera aquimaris]